MSLASNSGLGKRTGARSVNPSLLLSARRVLTETKKPIDSLYLHRTTLYLSVSRMNYSFQSQAVHLVQFILSQSKLNVAGK
jgi:hypothetical protein